MVTLISRPKCVFSLRLLQATIVGEYMPVVCAVSLFLNAYSLLGVVILHLLLIPGTAFLVGGSQIRHQALHPHHTDLNHSLLMIGYVPA